MAPTYRENIQRAIRELMEENNGWAAARTETQMADAMAEKIYRHFIKGLEEKLNQFQEDARTLFNESYQVIHQQVLQIESIQSERDALADCLAEIQSDREQDRQQLEEARKKALFWKQDAEFWPGECRKLSDQTK